MHKLTIFFNVFFRNEELILPYFLSIRKNITSHKIVFLINNTSSTFSTKTLEEHGEIIYVKDILTKNHSTNINKLIDSKNSKYVKHFIAGVLVCKTTYLSFFDPDNKCNNYSWIDESIPFLDENKSIIVSSPYWGNNKNNKQRIYLDTGFSDQLFIGKTIDFQGFDYSLNSKFSWMYPLREYGLTFESVVFSNMLLKKHKRAVFLDYKYFHMNEGINYKKTNFINDSRRYLARNIWKIASYLY